jgi:glycosyltransferase involved in cell wall biosynthesis
MHFIFVESFDRPDWNGQTSRFTKGVSGSHGGPMYLAEGLAKLGHKVDFVSIFNFMKETTYMGVNYINYENFQNTSCDYIIGTNQTLDFIILNKIYSVKKIILIMHNDLFFEENKIFFNINKEFILIAYLNEFGKTNIENAQPFLKEYENCILPNSIDLTDVRPFDISKKENSLCFFACVGRGLHLATEVVNRLDNFILYSNTYADEHRYLTNSNNKLIQTDGCSKLDIFRYLVKSKYFVYPLIDMENNMIHYDTFGYVVLEALLHGVIVIAPKIAVYEELYGDSICYVDTDGIIPEEDLLYWKKTNANFGFPLLGRYLDKINELENDEELRRSYIEKGVEVGKKYSNVEITNRLIEIININR